MLKKSDIIKVKIEKIVFGGEGLGYYEESFAIFVPMSVPDDILEVEIISVKKTYARGLIKKIIKAGPERIKSDKITFEDFDGCDFAMFKYEAQLKYKKIMVEDVIQKLGKVANFSLDRIIESKNILHYRNKIIEPFSIYNNKIITGFFKRKSHDVFEVEENILNSKLGNKIIKRLKELLNEKKISVYDEKTHLGLLRNIMIRTNSKNEAMLVLIINSNKLETELKNILLSLKDEFKEIKSIYFSSNTKKTNTLLGDRNTLICGSKYIQENIEGINFYISPSSFFQINLEQTKKLYALAISMFSNIEDKYIVDAYSGTGTIAMIMAKKAKKVYAIEIVRTATEDGKRTAQENGIKNIEFINGAVEEKLEELVDSKKQVDTIILDPPRKGLEASIINKVAELSLREVVYISCNPSTLARDIKLFTEKGYYLERLEAVDMFPQTSHVECVALMKKGNRFLCEKLWAENKYLVLSKSQLIYKRIREYLKEENVDINLLKILIKNAVDLDENPKEVINCLQHMWGYFKKESEECEKKKFFKLLDKYEKAEVPKEDILKYLKILLKKYPNEYLENSNILKLVED